jgi:hypothetical protein
MKKTFISLFAGIISVTTISSVKADVIADWTFQTAASTNNIIGAAHTPAATQSGILADIGTGTASASHASATTAWSVPSGNGSLNSWSANGWGVGDYYQFAVSTIGFTGITVSYDQTGSSTGPGKFFFQYSTDGVSFTTVGLANTILASTWTPSTNNAAFNFSYDISSVGDLNNATTVYFRLADAATNSIGGGTVAAGGTDRVDNFVVNGTITPAPEPSTVALMACSGVACLFAFRRRK